MGLKVWMPLNGHIKNYGCSPEVPTASGTISYETGGKKGKSAVLNSSRIIIPKTVMTSDFGSQCSVAMWVNFKSFNGSGYDTLFQAGTGEAAWVTYVIGLLRNHTNNSFIFVIGDTTTTTTNTYRSQTLLETGKWYHFALTYNNGEMKLYINGVLDTPAVKTNIVPAFDKITHITIGGTNNGVYLCNCKINDFRLYNHCLSTKEISEIFKGIILHYPLNQPDRSKNLLPDSWGKEQVLQLPSSGQKDIQITNIVTPDANSIYTCSFLAKSTVNNSKLEVFLYNNSTGRQVARSKNSQGRSAGIRDGNSTFYLSNVYEYYWVKWVFDANTTPLSKSLLFRIYSDSKGDITFKNVKLSKGDNPTPSYTDSTPPLIEYDTSGCGHNSTAPENNLPVANFNSPRYNECYAFDGTKYLKSIDYVKDMFPTDQITINLWANTTDWKNEDYRFLSCTNTGGFTFRIISSNFLFQLYVNNSYSPDPQCSIANLTAGWHMFTGTFDGQVQKVYIDGELKKQVDKPGTIVWSNSNLKLEIGRKGEDGGYFIGDMSDIRIYSTALTLNDIQELYNTAAFVNNNGSIIGYEFNELHLLGV